MSVSGSREAGSGDDPGSPFGSKWHQCFSNLSPHLSTMKMEQEKVN